MKMSRIRFRLIHVLILLTIVAVWFSTYLATKRYREAKDAELAGKAKQLQREANELRAQIETQGYELNRGDAVIRVIHP